MNILKLDYRLSFNQFMHKVSPISELPSTQKPPLILCFPPQFPALSAPHPCSSQLISHKNPRAASFTISSWENPERIDAQNEEIEIDSDAFKKTLRLVECAMFAAVTGLVYYITNSLAIENYFGCFFSLPIVISSMRWGLPAGRKTMVATALLLLTLSGPLKALTYLFMHGFVGFAMGSLWRLGANWTVSIIICTVVRAIGAVSYVVLSSFLLRENILSLIAVNIHASLSYMLAAVGINMIPSMKSIYTIFGCLLLINCGFFVFLLHILYAVFLGRLGIKASLRLPRWLEKVV